MVSPLRGLQLPGTLPGREGGGGGGGHAHPCEWEEDASRSCSHGRDGGGQEGLSKHKGICEAEGCLAEHGHEGVGDTPAQPRVDEPS